MGKRGPLAKNKLPIKVEVVKSSTSPYMPSAEDKERERRYRAEDDIRTLQRADEIRGDKDRMNACKDVAKEQIDTLKKIK